MNLVVYTQSTGEITCVVSATQEQLAYNEAIYIAQGYSCLYVEEEMAGVNKVVDGQPVYMEPAFDEAQALAKIRFERGLLLAGSDWTQMSDAPIPETLRQAWGLYRQALRDFPSTCDPKNVQWPALPTQ